MINPKDIINFRRDQKELEEFMLFCVLVAGKNSQTQAEKLEGFLKDIGKVYHETCRLYCSWYRERATWFEIMRRVEFVGFLRKHKLGQYNRIERAFKKLIHLDMETVTLEELVEIPGVGNKTARFFLMFTRPNQRFAVLDTHVLKFLRDRGYNVPKSTPNKNHYQKWEEVYLKLADESGMTLPEFDLSIWTKYNEKLDKAK